MFRKNFALLSLVNIYVKLTGLIIVPFVARRFSVEEFGMLALVQTVLGYILDCFDGGIRKVGIRELSRTSGRRAQVNAQVIFSIRSLLLVLGFLVMNAAAFVLFQEHSERMTVFLVSLSVLALIFDVTWIHDAGQDMRPASMMRSVERTVFLVLSLFAIYRRDFTMLVIAFPASSFISVVIAGFLNNHSIDLRFRPITRKIKYLKEGLIIGFAGIATSLCLTVDQFMIKHYMGTYQVGLYSAATKISFIVLTFLWIYAYALFPRLSRIHGNSDEVSRLLSRHVHGLGITGILLTGALAFCADPVIRLLFSEKFLEVLPVFKALNVFLMVAFFNVLLSEGLNAFDMQSKRMGIIIKALILNIALNVWMIPIWGLMGAVCASICAQVFILYFSYAALKKSYPLRMGPTIAVFLLLNAMMVVLSFESLWSVRT